MGDQVRRISLDPPRRDLAHKDENAVKRVAAYCRVSTDQEEQLNSFDNQVKTYTGLIEATAGWTLAGIYADEGITGTSAEKRPDFMRMIEDCEDGKIDIFITKSISRFARNTLECLVYVRKLQNLGVRIIFESNNIDTGGRFSEMILTVLAAFAQEESRSISENTKWGIRKRYEDGISRWSNIYGYCQTADGDYQIVPEQAAVIQKIYDLYEKGEVIADIVEFLAEYHIPSPKGEERWKPSSVAWILKNEKYVGDILLQKTVIVDHLSHKKVKNDCREIPAYYIENHHQAIVGRKQWDRVQKIRQLRARGPEGMRRPNGACVQYPMGPKLICPYCGSTLYQRNTPVTSYRGCGWRCEKGENACKNFIMRSDLVEKAVLNAYRKLDMDDIRAQLDNPALQPAAEMALKIKTEHPEMERVDYYWVDDMIDHITFGKHTLDPKDIIRKKAKGEEVADDRTMTVYWKCGLKTTVFSEVRIAHDDPVFIARRFNAMLERRTANA